MEFIPKSRNAHIALMDTVLTGFKRGERTEDDLFVVCQRYFDQHKHKLYAFKDLRGVLETRDDALIHRVAQHCMDSVEGKPVSAKSAKLSQCELIHFPGRCYSIDQRVQVALLRPNFRQQERIEIQHRDSCAQLPLLLRCIHPSSKDPGPKERNPTRYCFHDGKSAHR